MRILFLTPTLGLGGSERLTVGYAAGLKARGHEVAIAYSIKNRHEEATDQAGIDTFNLAKDVPSRRSLGEWVTNMRRVVRRLRPDVIHAQSVATAAIARIAAPRVPVLVTMHGVPPDDEAAAALALRAMGAHVLAVSDATAAGLQRFPWSPKVEVLHAGVDITRIESDTRRFGPVVLAGSPKLCCVARQTPQKGIDVLIRAMTYLTDELPDVGLTFVGNGAELDANIALSEKLGLSDCVHFAGGVPNASPHIAAADAIVLSSRWEGLPVVALEALALETPLVATAVNGTPTVCIDGETGWLVPPDDERALADAILECVRHPEEAARRARAGRELVEASFSVERMLDRLEALLICTRSRRQRVPATKPHAYYRAARRYESVRRASAGRRPARAWTGVRIFGYHRVTPEAGDVYGLTPERFREQMEALAASDVEIVRLDKALDLLEEPVSERFACVTFDDGYLDNLVHGLPVLEELGIPATIFAIGDVLEGRIPFTWYRSAPPPGIAVGDLPDLLRTGLVDVQSHSATHPRLTTLSDAELRREVAGAKEALERHLPYELTSFCYPAGLYTQREVAIVLASGYRAGVTTQSGVNPGGIGLGELRRTMIQWGDTIDVFELKLSGRLDDPSWLRERLHARRIRGSARSRALASTV